MTGVTLLVHRDLRWYHHPFGYYGSLDGYLKALAQRFGETAQAIHS